jgi:FkbM family methyltransferase
MLMTNSLVGYWIPYFLKQHGMKYTIIEILFFLDSKFKKLFHDFSKEHTVEVNDCSLLLIPNDVGISEELLIYNVHEPFSTNVLMKNLREGMVCIDVGGNLGYYATLESKMVGKTGQVIAIEPSPVSFKFLQHNLDLQNESNSEALNFACGDEEGEVRFLITDKSNLNRVLKENEETTSDMNVVTVPVKTLDSFVKEKSFKKLDFIRMDAEGYEVQILDGAKESIEKFKPMIQVEVHLQRLGKDNTKKLLKGLADHGYENVYSIARELDISPKFQDESNMQKTNLEKLLKDLKDDVLPRCFILFLEKPIN